LRAHIIALAEGSHHALHFGIAVGIEHFEAVWQLHVELNGAKEVCYAHTP
jgi:hypothetical protein